MDTLTQRVIDILNEQLGLNIVDLESGYRNELRECAIARTALNGFHSALMAFDTGLEVVKTFGEEPVVLSPNEFPELRVWAQRFDDGEYAEYALESLCELCNEPENECECHICGEGDKYMPSCEWRYCPYCGDPL